MIFFLFTGREIPRNFPKPLPNFGILVNTKKKACTSISINLKFDWDSSRFHLVNRNQGKKLRDSLSVVSSG